jgi:hypothetical protein
VLGRCELQHGWNLHHGHRALPLWSDGLHGGPALSAERKLRLIAQAEARAEPDTRSANEVMRSTRSSKS